MNAVTITIPSTVADGKPIIVSWKRENGRWQRYWTGYNHEGEYEVNSHDWGAKGGPEDEMRWAQQVGHEVDIK